MANPSCDCWSPRHCFECWNPNRFNSIAPFHQCDVSFGHESLHAETCSLHRCHESWGAHADDQNQTFSLGLDRHGHSYAQQSPDLQCWRCLFVSGGGSILPNLWRWTCGRLYLLQAQSCQAWACFEAAWSQAFWRSRWTTSTASQGAWKGSEDFEVSRPSHLDSLEARLHLCGTASH